MTFARPRRTALAAAASWLCAACAGIARRPVFPTAVGAFVESMQRERKVAGAVTLVARQGRLVWRRAHGLADLESARPMRTDDLFQLQSMTKPIASVAALQLVERGAMHLADPLARFLPEFGDAKVAVASGDAPGGYELVPAARPITILDLLTHRAGFPGLPPGDSPGERQPGTAFRYGPATTVLGRVIEVAAGRPLDVALHEQIFRPLGMTETFFAVPPAQQARVVTPHVLRAGQRLVRLAPDLDAPRFASAGAGSTR